MGRGCTVLGLRRESFFKGVSSQKRWTLYCHGWSCLVRYKFIRDWALKFVQVPRAIGFVTYAQQMTQLTDCNMWSKPQHHSRRTNKHQMKRHHSQTEMEDDLSSQTWEEPWLEDQANLGPTDHKTTVTIGGSKLTTMDPAQLWQGRPLS